MKREKDYRLWREYLKRSDKYKKFCQLINKGFIPGETARVNRGLTYADKKIFMNENLMKTWTFFGDVFSNNFEDWWPPNIPEILKPVVELEEAINKPTTFTQLRMSAFKRRQGRVPSICEFAQFRIKDCIYVRISMNDTTTLEDIKINISAIWKSKNKEHLMRSKEDRLNERLNNRRYYKPTGRVRQQLADYLKIFDLKKQNLKWNEVMQQFPLNISGADEDRKRTYLLYKQKAINIIKNVEEGYFPGLYN